MRTPQDVRDARRAFAREHDGRQRDLPATRVAQLSANAAERAAGVAMNAIANASIATDELRFALPTDPDNPIFEQIVRLYVMSTPGFRDWLTEHAEAIASTFTSRITEADYDKRMAEFDRELVEIEEETKRSEIVARREAADAELAALESQD
jgi:hypothetical protein